MKKQCFKCKKILPISNFYKHKEMRDGYFNKCKKCVIFDGKAENGLYERVCLVCGKSFKAQGGAINRGFAKTCSRKCFYKRLSLLVKGKPHWWNKGENNNKWKGGVSFDKEYVKNRHLNYLKKYNKEKRKTNPKFRLDANIATAVYKVLRSSKKWKKWQDLVGYKIEELISHLEKQFDDKMTWNNYGSYWEVDHIKPKSLFKYETAEDPEFKKCWALNNLQPLEKSENRVKRNSDVSQINF